MYNKRGLGQTDGRTGKRKEKQREITEEKEEEERKITSHAAMSERVRVCVCIGCVRFLPLLLLDSLNEDQVDGICRPSSPT